MPIEVNGCKPFDNAFQIGVINRNTGIFSRLILVISLALLRSIHHNSKLVFCHVNHLHKFRFVCPLKSKSFNPRRKLLMPDAALENLAVHQLCAFAARRKAFVRLADATPTGGRKRDDRLAGQVIALKKCNVYKCVE